MKLKRAIMIECCTHMSLHLILLPSSLMRFHYYDLILSFKTCKREKNMKLTFKKECSWIWFAIYMSALHTSSPIYKYVRTWELRLGHVQAILLQIYSCSVTAVSHAFTLTHCMKYVSYPPTMEQNWTKVFSPCTIVLFYSFSRRSFRISANCLFNFFLGGGAGFNQQSKLF